jgi:hypothetical protein
MKLEAANAEVADESSRLASPHLPLCWIDARKWNQNVTVIRHQLRHLLIIVAPEPRLALGVHREDHGADLALAKIGGCFWDRRRMFELRLEIGVHTGLEGVISIVGVRATRFFRVRVNIDRLEFTQLEHLRCLSDGHSEMATVCFHRP